MLLGQWKSIVSAGLLAAACTGCSTLPNTVVRGQSPEQARQLVHEEPAGWKPSTSPIEQVAGVNHRDSRLHGEFKGQVQNQLNANQVSRHGYRTPVGPGTYAPGGNIGYAEGTNPYARWGNFDQQPCPVPGNAGFGTAPPNHQELNWDHGGRRHPGQYHYHTYRYKEPNCQVYPAANQPGGVVTYPYYTHKGPSDFFMK